MYHIKNDRRSIRSAEKITQGLALCIKGKKIDNVGVSEIAAASGVSRGTFYRLFDSPVDVMAYTCEKLAQEAIEASADAYFTNWRNYTEFALRFCMTHSNVLETIFGAGRNDIIENAIAKFSEGKDGGFPSVITIGFSEEDQEYLRNTSVASICAIVFTWIKHGRKETTEELMALHDAFFKITD